MTLDELLEAHRIFNARRRLGFRVNTMSVDMVEALFELAKAQLEAKPPAACECLCHQGSRVCACPCVFHAPDRATIPLPFTEPDDFTP